MEIKTVRPAHRDSCEFLCHESAADAFVLPLGDASPKVREALGEARLVRAISVVYAPVTELQSHYFYADLPRQFDEYVWFDETRAVTPLGSESAGALPQTFPFGV